jgi:large subunit ribosomal protein L9
MARRKIENKTIEVILLQSDKHLGEKYEIVRVKPIYAKNVLFPNNMAVLADAVNKNNYGQKMAAAEEHRRKKASGFDDLFMKIQNDNGLLITRKTNKDHTLYAKVSEEDISKAIHEIYGMEIESHLFKLKKKINTLGNHNVPFMYKDIKKEIVVRVEEEKEAKEEKTK